MTELIYHVATSLDNFICDMDGSAKDFLQEGDHIADFMEEIKNYGAVLMGKRTYEYGYQFGMKPGEPGYKGLKHFIFSKSLDFPSNADVELVKTDSIKFIDNLKVTNNKPLWLCGGGELAGVLVDHKLIDRLILKINPIYINYGVPLFDGFKKIKIGLELMDFKRYKSGVLRPEYKILYR
jgi:dihydrofolate reductase